MTPEQYCEEKLQKSHSSFTFSFLFLTEKQRNAMSVLYAFCREIDDIVDEMREPTIARIKLEWWRNDINEAFSQGKPQHPISQALMPLLQEYPLKQDYFMQMIEGMEMDLELFRYPDFTALSHYCYCVAGTVGLLSIAIFGYQQSITEKYAKELAMALQLINTLRDVKEDAARHRIYLPLDELKQFGVTEYMLLNGKQNKQTLALFEFQAKRAKQYYQTALATLPSVDRWQQRSGLIMANIYYALLEHIEKQHYPVLQHRVRLPTWKKFWIAWRTVRKENAYQTKSISCHPPTI
jgi:phytoene synthase